MNWEKIKKVYSDHLYIVYEDDEGYLLMFKREKHAPFLEMKARARDEGIIGPKEGFMELYKKMDVRIELESNIPTEFLVIWEHFNKWPRISVKHIDWFEYVVTHKKNIYKIIIGADKDDCPCIKECDEIK